MKKITLSLAIFIISVMFICPVRALEVYSSNFNTYYQRGQHTYAWHEPSGIKHENFAPAIYIIYEDYDDAALNQEWNFDEKYSREYDPAKDNNYYLVLCADLIYDFWPVKRYSVVNIDASTYIKDEIKRNIAGIVNNTYPYISQEEMIKNLVDAGYLVETENTEGEKVYTAKKNVEDKLEVKFNIHRDELLAAIQAAIYKYTDPDRLDNYYFKTVGQLSTNFSVIDREAAYTETGNYEVVKNNIDAVYNYLITLSSDYYETLAIENVVGTKNKELLIKLNNTTDDVSKLTFVVSEDGKKIAEIDLKDLKRNELGYYVIQIDNATDIMKVSVNLKGTVHRSNEVLVLEAEKGPQESQTLVGLGSADIDIDNTYDKEIPILDVDISITKEVDDDYLQAGDVANFKIKVKNESKEDLDDVVLKDEILPELEVLDPDGGKIDNGFIVWKLSLKAEEEKEFNVKYKVKEDVKDKDLLSPAKVTLYNIEKEASVKVQIVNNPSTGISIPIVALSIGGLITIAGVTFLVRKNKLYKI